MPRVLKQTNIHIDQDENINATVTPYQRDNTCWLAVELDGERICLFMSAAQMRAIGQQMVCVAAAFDSAHAAELETV